MFYQLKPAASKGYALIFTMPTAEGTLMETKRTHWRSCQVAYVELRAMVATASAIGKQFAVLMCGGTDDLNIGTGQIVIADSDADAEAKGLAWYAAGGALAFTYSDNGHETCVSPPQVRP